ncbi:hypothetical protein [Pseudodesulfovibrio senegalensis]|jgi:hypothetical protein|uniref:Uncharacterized protein n=1 Tax=Pseudodesulfovibrio senegalensis TaxID=1721087 RepID=A0A6N6N562_9BACT|nr:hypothetical protein [Pseudodesulfovibrio senegalensis]KAB1442918.1 hypothetical protein F8A88_01190 [Pseudodesulfovibrio senegalensis]
MNRLETETWEVMQSCKRLLGTTRLQKIFSRGRTQINRYCMDPRFEDAQRNPLDRLIAMFKLVVQAGGEETVRAALNMLASPLGCRVQELDAPVPDKETVEEECLDDYPELVELNRLIAMRSHPDTVRRQAEITMREIGETCTLYEQVWKERS